MLTFVPILHTNKTEYVWLFHIWWFLWQDILTQADFATIIWVDRNFAAFFEVHSTLFSKIYSIYIALINQALHSVEFKLEFKLRLHIYQPLKSTFIKIVTILITAEHNSDQFRTRNGYITRLCFALNAIVYMYGYIFIYFQSVIRLWCNNTDCSPIIVQCNQLRTPKTIRKGLKWNYQNDSVLE